LECIASYKSESIEVTREDGFEVNMTGWSPGIEEYAEQGKEQNSPYKEN
jgi:hypothetical protein